MKEDFIKENGESSSFARVERFQGEVIIRLHCRSMIFIPLNAKKSIEY